MSHGTESGANEIAKTRSRVPETTSGTDWEGFDCEPSTRTRTSHKLVNINDTQEDENSTSYHSVHCSTSDDLNERAECTSSHAASHGKDVGFTELASKIGGEEAGGMVASMVTMLQQMKDSMDALPSKLHRVRLSRRSVGFFAMCFCISFLICCERILRKGMVFYLSDLGCPL